MGDSTTEVLVTARTQQSDPAWPDSRQGFTTGPSTSPTAIRPPVSTIVPTPSSPAISALIIRNTLEVALDAARLGRGS